MKQAEENENPAPKQNTFQRVWTGPVNLEDMSELDSDLPSGGFFYTFEQKLRIRQLQIAEVEKLIVAATQESEYMVADVVGRCISWPVHELTLGDYFFILYWLRLNSYPKSPLIITWPCPACMSRAKLQRGLDYSYVFDERETVAFKRVSRIDNDGPTIIPILEQDIVDLPPEIDLPRVSHWVDFHEWKKKTNPDEGRILSAKYAMYLNGGSFMDRLNKLVSAKDLDLYELARAAAYKYGEHGPSERATVKCSAQECGAVYEVPLVVSPTRFLSTI